MARKQASKKARSFEESITELEELVEAMENDQLPLEELVAHYEKGAGLLQHCEQVLAAAKKRIELIEVSGSREKELDQEPEATDDQESAGGSAPSHDDDDHDIRLL